MSNGSPRWRSVAQEPHREKVVREAVAAQLAREHAPLLKEPLPAAFDMALEVLRRAEALERP
jgi:hypothetical protein